MLQMNVKCHSFLSLSQLPLTAAASQQFIKTLCVWLNYCISIIIKNWKETIILNKTFLAVWFSLKGWRNFSTCRYMVAIKGGKVRIKSKAHDRLQTKIIIHIWGGIATGCPRQLCLPAPVQRERLLRCLDSKVWVPKEERGKRNQISCLSGWNQAVCSSDEMFSYVDV